MTPPSSGLFLATICNQSQLAERKHVALVDIGCSNKRAPLSVSYYNEISGGHIGSYRCSEEGLCRPSTASVFITFSFLFPVSSHFPPFPVFTPLSSLSFPPFHFDQFGRKPWTVATPLC